MGTDDPASYFMRRTLLLTMIGKVTVLLTSDELHFSWIYSGCSNFDVVDTATMRRLRLLVLDLVLAGLDEANDLVVSGGDVDTAADMRQISGIMFYHECLEITDNEQR